MLKRLKNLIMYNGEVYEIDDYRYIEKKTGRKINMMSHLGQKITQSRTNAEEPPR